MKDLSWIMEVLDELKVRAQMQGSSKLLEMISEARDVAEIEISQQLAEQQPTIHTSAASIWTIVDGIPKPLKE